MPSCLPKILQMHASMTRSHKSVNRFTMMNRMYVQNTVAKPHAGPTAAHKKEWPMHCHFCHLLSEPVWADIVLIKVRTKHAASADMMVHTTLLYRGTKNTNLQLAPCDFKRENMDTVTCLCDAVPTCAIGFSVLDKVRVAQVQAVRLESNALLHAQCIPPQRPVQFKLSQQHIKCPY